MKRFDLKQLIICILAVLASRFELAGVYPLVPAIFMTGFLSGVNKSLIFICTIVGLIVLAPATAMVKYGLAVIVSALAVLFLEWYLKRCRTAVAALIAAASTTAVTVSWEFLGIPNTASVFAGILEGVFIYGFVYVFARVGAVFLDWDPIPKRFVPAPVPGEDGQRLSNYAESFEKLSQTFQRMNRYKDDFTAEELSRMQNEVTGRICVSCSQCALCWEREDTPMYQVLYRFLQSLYRGTPVEEGAQELGSYCPYAGDLVDQVLMVFEKARLNMAWYNRLQENRDVIAQQLDAMAYIMEDCARGERDLTREEGKTAASVRYVLKDRGVDVDGLQIVGREGGKREIRFWGHTRGKRCISVKEMAKIISNASGRAFAPARNSRALLGEKQAALVFTESSRLAAGYGVARAVREGEQVSGDCFSFQTLDNGTCMMGVSDGMGSGYAACKESEMVIDLIEKFMEAGFRPDTALRMMNSAMVTHGDHNLFSTIDLMCLNLDDGVGEFYKIGASATFIRRKDEVSCIECASMPVGVFAGQQVPQTSRQLAAGDWVVMVTDGVLEHLDVADAKGMVMDIIREVKSGNPSRFAREVLEQVLTLTGGRVRDDMTVLAAKIWQNGDTEAL